MIGSVAKAWRALSDDRDEPRSGVTRADFLRIVAAGVATAGVGITAGKAVAAAGRRAIARITDIEQLYDVWQDRFNAADLEGMVDLYVANVTYVNPQGKALPGHAGVRADFLEAFAMKPRIDIHNRKHLVYGDTVLTTNHWTMWVPGADGKQEQLTGGGIEVLRKQSDGAWRFIIDDASRSAS